MIDTFRPAAIITAYLPDHRLLAAVRSVLDQVDHVVVVDDGSPAAGDVLDECAFHGAAIVRHDENRGIGAALNTGIDDALRRDPALTHVLTMDQDSVLPDGYLMTLVEAEQRALEEGVAVGMVSPGAIATVRRARPGGTGGFAPGGEPIQSGLLLPVRTLDAVGEFDESLVIDGVDTDYWLRALDLGLAAIVAPDVVLEHQLGHPIVLPSGRRVPLVVASDFRYFYQWRNLVLLIRRHGRRHPRWAAGAIVRAMRHLVLVTVFAQGRTRRLQLSLKGAAAGVRGERGPSRDRV